MFKSEHFGRAFWVDYKNEFRSCPLKLNNEPDFEYADYVSEWQDLEGLDLNKLLNIHKIELLNVVRIKNTYEPNDYNYTQELYNEVKKCYNSNNLEDNYSYIDSLLTAGT